LSRVERGRAAAKKFGEFTAETPRTQSSDKGFFQKRKSNPPLRPLCLCGAIFKNLREPLKLIGEDRIMLGSGMPHSESHPNSFQKFQERSDLSAVIKAKILNDNARRFFSR
jgi:Amidohydrolase